MLRSILIHIIFYVKWFYQKSRTHLERSYITLIYAYVDQNEDLDNVDMQQVNVFICLKCIYVYKLNVHEHFYVYIYVRFISYAKIIIL